jgi:hypothetical protein
VQSYHQQLGADVEALTYLRVYRERLISQIKAKTGLTMPEHFKVTSAGAERKGYTFEITFAERQFKTEAWASLIETDLGIKNLFPLVERDCMVADFKTAVLKKLDEKGSESIKGIARELEDLKKSEQKGGGFVPVQKATEKKEEKPVMPVKPDITQKIEQKGVPVPGDDDRDGRKDTFLNFVRDTLKDILPETELRKQYVLKKHERRLDVAELYVRDESLMSKVLYKLENAGCFVFCVVVTVLVSKSSSFIESLPIYKRHAHALKICRERFSQLTKWFSENSVLAQIRTHPLIPILSNFEQEVVVECNEHSDAVMLQALCEANSMPCLRNIRMVYIALRLTDLAKPLIIIKPDRPENSGEKKGFVKIFETEDYDMLHFLSFNRDIDEEHVEKIGQSIDEFGAIDVVKVVYTNCVDGTYKYWIVDGQHTFCALRKRKKPVRVLLIQIDTMFELVRLVAVLNNRRKLWKLIDYLKAWASLKIGVYQKIVGWLLVKIPFTVILQGLTGKERNVAVDIFKDGNLRDTVNMDGERVLGHVGELIPMLPRQTNILSAALKNLFHPILIIMLSHRYEPQNS